MNRNAFHQLLKRYAEDACSEEEKRLIDQWYELLDDTSEQPTHGVFSSETEQRMWDNIRGRVRKGGVVPIIPISASGRRRWIKWIAAAFLIGALSTAFYIYRMHPSKAGEAMLHTKLTEGLAEKANHTLSPQTYTLEDGSTVILDPGATLAYPVHFALDKREVFLEGSAYFDIRKNPSKPFYVYNDRIVTQVLGTSFSIKAEKEQVEVSVHTGRVAVYEKGEPAPQTSSLQKMNGVIITINEKATYYNEDKHFVTSLVDAPLTVAVANGKPREVVFDFEDAPLSEVLDSLSKAYNIQIIVENENLNHCPFTGDISGQSLYNKLEMICESLRASYDINGTSILIKGKGCN